MFTRLVTVVFSLILLSVTSLAETITPTQEARANALFHQIKCPVCQGQSLAESDVEIAVGLKNLVRERIAKGQTDAQIFEHLTTIYGDDILFTPPHKSDTFFLWYGPYVLMILGATLFLLKKIKRKNE